MLLSFFSIICFYLFLLACPRRLWYVRHWPGHRSLRTMPRSWDGAFIVSLPIRDCMRNGPLIIYYWAALARNVAARVKHIYPAMHVLIDLSLYTLSAAARPIFSRHRHHRAAADGDRKRRRRHIWRSRRLRRHQGGKARRIPWCTQREDILGPQRPDFSFWLHLRR